MRLRKRPHLENAPAGKRGVLLGTNVGSTLVLSHYSSNNLPPNSRMWGSKEAGFGEKPHWLSPGAPEEGPQWRQGERATPGLMNFNE